MKRIIVSPYVKLVKENYAMWKFLSKKKIIQSPLLLYRAQYFFKIKLGQNLAMRSFRKKGLFISTHIETYAYCNRKCSFCFNHDRFPQRSLGIMSESIWKRIIDELSELRFSGKISPYYYGEPLLDKRLSSVIAYAREKCPISFIEINTNGDFLTEKRLLDLIKNGINRILVTNYYSVGIEDRPPSAVMRATKRLIYLAKKYPQFVELRNWYDMMLINRCGVIFNKENTRKNDPCLRPLSQLVIDWQGNVILCCNDYYSEYRIGNVEKESILDLWRKARFNYFREILESGNREKIKICAGCDVAGEIE